MKKVLLTISILISILSLTGAWMSFNEAERATLHPTEYQFGTEAATAQSPYYQSRENYIRHWNFWGYTSLSMFAGSICLIILNVRKRRPRPFPAALKRPLS